MSWQPNSSGGGGGGDGGGTSLPESVLLDAVQQFLDGREWRASLQRFVDSRCESFAGMEEHKHNQYEVFGEYQSFVEAMLESTLADLGAKAEDFVAALERKLKRASDDDPAVPFLHKVCAARV